MTQHITFYAAKGGQGTTTTAISAATMIANSGKSVLLLGQPDIYAACGLPPSEGVVEVAPNLSVSEYDSYRATNINWDFIITDRGVTAYKGYDNARVLVTRPCYLSLRAAVNGGSKPDYVVLINEEGRALNARDVERALAPSQFVVETPQSPAVARLVDAGLLVSRVPESSLGAALRSIIDDL